MQPLAIVGASARAAAFSALRAGYTPLTADLFADADLARRAQATRIADYPWGLLGWLRTTPPETPWIYTGALENHPDLVDEMATERTLLGCAGSVLQTVRDPLGLAKVLAEVSVRFPETHEAGTFARPAHATDWLLKTCRGSSGTGTRVWDGSSTAGKETPLFLQRRIEGFSGSALFVAADGAACLIGLTRQLVGTAWAHAAPFQYAGSIGPWDVGDAPRESLQRAAAALAELGVVGHFGIDFVRSREDGEAYVTEVNPRYTASVETVERMTGTAVLAEHVAATSCRGSGPWPVPHAPAKVADTPRTRPPKFFGKAILFARNAVRVQDAFAKWALSQATAADFPPLADLPHPGSEIAAGRPVLTVFAEGDSHEDVERRLQRDLEDVERRLFDGG